MDGVRSPKLASGSTEALLGSLIDTDGFIPTGSQLFRRTWLERVSGYRDVGLIEDVDLYLRLAMAGAAFVYCASSAPLFFYRRHDEGSLSTRSRLDFTYGVMRNARLIEAWASARTDLKSPLRESLVRSYFYCARALAGEDWRGFDEAVRRIRDLTGEIRPSSPRSLAILSRIIGYKSAERTAVAWRSLKRSLRNRPGRQCT
jgi:GT2 family glycosyltransferase